MKEFYKVELEYGEIFYFRNRDNAHDFLWQSFLNCMNGFETAKEIQAAKDELNEFSMISEVGMIFTCGFED